MPRHFERPYELRCLRDRLRSWARLFRWGLQSRLRRRAQQLLRRLSGRDYVGQQLRRVRRGVHQPASRQRAVQRFKVRFRVRRRLREVRHGVHRHQPKPFELRQLRTRVRRARQRRRHMRGQAVRFDVQRGLRPMRR